MWLFIVGFLLLLGSFAGLAPDFPEGPLLSVLIMAAGVVLWIWNQGEREQLKAIDKEAEAERLAKQEAEERSKDWF